MPHKFRPLDRLITFDEDTAMDREYAKLPADKPTLTPVGPRIFELRSCLQKVLDVRESRDKLIEEKRAIEERLREYNTAVERLEFAALCEINRVVNGGGQRMIEYKGRLYGVVGGKLYDKDVPVVVPDEGTE